MQCIIDARADEAQRRALIAVLQGQGAEPGSNMLKIYRDMCSTWHEPVFSTIKLDIDIEGRTARLSIPDLVETEIEPLKNPVSGAEHRARIDLPMGKEFLIAEVASGTTEANGAVPLEFAFAMTVSALANASGRLAFGVETEDWRYQRAESYA